MTATVDPLDCRLLSALSDTPRASVLELARQLGVARGTAQSRLDRIQARGIVIGFGPDIDVEALGYEVLAFAAVHVTQGQLTEVVTALSEIPEILEVHAVVGDADLHCRLVARTNAHLQQVLDRVLAVPGVWRATTTIALSEQIGYRVLPLVQIAHLGQTASHM
jgi:DNA-binding Lrp family transcriptional regulator